MFATLGGAGDEVGPLFDSDEFTRSIDGTETEQSWRCAHPGYDLGRIESGTAPRCRLWHWCAKGNASAAVDYGRRRHRQDQHAGAPGGEIDPRRCRLASFAIADLHTPRGGRDDPTRTENPYCEPWWRDDRRRCRIIALVGHISFDRQSVVTTVRR